LALEAFHSAGAVAARSGGNPAPLDAWWIGFNDPQLVRIVQRVTSCAAACAASLAAHMRDVPMW
jgi:hypothetical protein